MAVSSEKKFNNLKKHKPSIPKGTKGNAFAVPPFLALRPALVFFRSGAPDTVFRRRISTLPGSL
jgi:hypothetical protein